MPDKRFAEIKIFHLFCRKYLNLETHVKWDASCSRWGAALEQLTVDGGKPIGFVSRFLNSCGERYRVKKVESLGVVRTRIIGKYRPTTTFFSSKTAPFKQIL